MTDTTTTLDARLLSPLHREQAHLLSRVPLLSHIDALEEMLTSAAEILVESDPSPPDGTLPYREYSIDKGRWTTRRPDQSPCYGQPPSHCTYCMARAWLVRVGAE